MGNRPLIDLVSRNPGAAAQLCLFTSALRNGRNGRKAGKYTHCSMDVIYFLRILCKKKKLCLYPETVPKLGQSLEESLAGGGLVKNLKIF